MLFEGISLYKFQTEFYFHFLIVLSCHRFKSTTFSNQNFKHSIWLVSILLFYWYSVIQLPSKFSLYCFQLFSISLVLFFTFHENFLVIYYFLKGLQNAWYFFKINSSISISFRLFNTNSWKSLVRLKFKISGWHVMNRAKYGMNFNF